MVRPGRTPGPIRPNRWSDVCAHPGPAPGNTSIRPTVCPHPATNHPAATEPHGSNPEHHHHTQDIRAHAQREEPRPGLRQSATVQHTDTADTTDEPGRSTRQASRPRHEPLSLSGRPIRGSPDTGRLQSFPRTTSTAGTEADIGSNSPRKAAPPPGSNEKVPIATDPRPDVNPAPGADKSSCTKRAVSLVTFPISTSHGLHSPRRNPHLIPRPQPRPSPHYTSAASATSS